MSDRTQQILKNLLRINKKDNGTAGYYRHIFRLFLAMKPLKNMEAFSFGILPFFIISFIFSKIKTLLIFCQQNDTIKVGKRFLGDVIISYALYGKFAIICLLKIFEVRHCPKSDTIR